MLLLWQRDGLSQVRPAAFFSLFSAVFQPLFRKLLYSQTISGLFIIFAKFLHILDINTLYPNTINKKQPPPGGGAYQEGIPNV